MGSVFTEFTQNLDAALAAVAANMFWTLANNVGPFLVLLIAVTLAFYIFSMATRRVFDVVGMIYFVARSSLIYGLVTGGAIWTNYVFPFISEFGQKVGLLVYSRMGSGGWNSTDGFNLVLDSYFTNVIEASEQLRSLIDSGTFITGAELLGIIASLFTVFFALIMIGIAFTILTIAKTFLFIFLAIAPLFLVWAFLGATKSIFEGWLHGIVRLLIVQILVFTILGFFVGAANNLLADAKTAIDTIGGLADPDRYLLSQMWTLTFISIVGTAMLVAVPSMSNAVAGGAVSVGATTASFASGTLTSGFSRGVAGAGNAVGGALGRVGGGNSAGGAVGAAGAARAAAERGGTSAKDRAARLIRQVNLGGRRR